MQRIALDDDDEAGEREFLHGFDRIEQRITLRNEAERRVKYAKGARRHVCLCRKKKRGWGWGAVCVCCSE